MMYDFLNKRTPHAAKTQSSGSDEAIAQQTYDNGKLLSRKPRHQRPPSLLGSKKAKKGPSLCFTYVKIMLMISTFIGTLIGLLLIGFFKFDAIGVPLTEALIRKMMPRPEHFKQPDGVAGNEDGSNTHLEGRSRISVDELRDIAKKEMATVRVKGKAGFKTTAAKKDIYLGDGNNLSKLTELLRDSSHSQQHYEATGGRKPFTNNNKDLETLHEFEYLFHRPNLVKYGPHQWLWDSCFHIMIIADTDPVDALHDLQSMFAMQDPHTGFIPEMIYWQPDGNQHGIAGEMFGYGDPERRFTDLTQMPMILYPIERLYKKLKALEDEVLDRENEEHKGQVPLSAQFLAFYLPKALHYLEYWRRHRDPNKNNLVSIIHPWESGLDASPLYDPVHGFFYRGATSHNGAPARGSGPIDSHHQVFGMLGKDTPLYSGVGHVPTPEELYPKFIVLLYRYRHRHKWNITDIFANCKERFDVEDIGVNAILADNFRLVSVLSDELVSVLQTDVFQHLGSYEEEESGTRLEAQAIVKELDALRYRADVGFYNIAHTIFTTAWEGDSKFFRSFGWSPQHQTHIALAGRTVQGLMPLLLLHDGAINHYRSIFALHHSGDATSKTPLLAGPPVDASKLLKMRTALLAAISDPTDFGLPYAVPTTSHKNVAFDPKDSSLMWRGPTWPTTNWFVFEAAWRVGRDTALHNAEESSHHHIHAEGVKENHLPESVHAVNVATRLLASWLRAHQRAATTSSQRAESSAQNSRTTTHPFHEYYCPKSGHPLGQAGLGMSHAVIDVLNALQHPHQTTVLSKFSRSKVLLTQEDRDADSMRNEGGGGRAPATIMESLATKVLAHATAAVEMKVHQQTPSSTLDGGEKKQEENDVVSLEKQKQILGLLEAQLRHGGKRLSSGGKDVGNEF